MNRRSAIKQFIILSAGVAMLPSCNNDSKRISAYNNITIDEDQQAMLADVAEIVIPKTTTPGAKDVQVQAHIFALQMMNDCYNAEDRERFTKGMQQFNDNVQKQYKKPFVQCSAPEKQAIIAAENGRKDAKDDVQYFYSTLKGLAAMAYTSSKYFLTNVQPYQLVPGKYIPSVAV